MSCSKPCCKDGNKYPDTLGNVQADVWEDYPLDTICKNCSQTWSDHVGYDCQDVSPHTTFIPSE